MFRPRCVDADVHKHGGGGLLSSMYNNSVGTALRRLFPEKNLKEWKFQCSPKGFWRNPANQRKCIHRIIDAYHNYY